MALLLKAGISSQLLLHEIHANPIGHFDRLLSGPKVAALLSTHYVRPERMAMHHANMASGRAAVDRKPVPVWTERMRIGCESHLRSVWRRDPSVLRDVLGLF